ncbi:MAG: hypothetical protein WAZ12_00210 [Candidatus Absconditicoccaceae bacterium]
METENEKSIEQIALEDYAKEKLDQRYESIGVYVGIIVGILSAVFFVFSVIYCETCLHDYAMIALFAIVMAVITGMFAMACVVIFSLVSRRNEKIIEKSISLLSKEDSKKIISDYLQKKIKSWQDNIPYSEGEIQKLQLEIEELKESIERSNEQIPELQEKLKNL